MIAVEGVGRSNKTRDYAALTHRLQNAGRSPHVRLETLGSFAAGDNQYQMQMVHLGKPDSNKLTVLISAGIHGDEPAGVEAALQFIEHNVDNPVLLSHYSFTVFPCDNPYGWERGTRENSQGHDLNRQFKAPEPSPEVRLIMSGLRGKCADLVYEMHEDYDSPGFYLYEFAEDPVAYLGESIVHEVSSFGYPINHSHIIEQRRARNGIIRPNMATYRKTRLPSRSMLIANAGASVNFGNAVNLSAA